MTTGPGAGRSAAAGAVIAPPHIFQEGDLVAERYRIVRFLAEGGGGEVYAAEDRALGIEVAMKTLRSGDRDLDDPEPAVRRFKREIHLARQVTHPNVCRIYDLGQHRQTEEEGGDTIFFLTMELLEGETLRERIRRLESLELSEALAVARQIADALEAARAANVVHRDLKSANVMLVPAESEEMGFRAVVTDFGLARWERQSDSARTTRAGMVVGTPEYMAPEQLDGGQVTAKTDIYAFGMVLYEMVTGRLPFQGSSPLVTALQRLREEPSSPSIYMPDLDPRWEETILRCLERDPADRFDTAEEVIAALEPEEEVVEPIQEIPMVGGVSPLAWAAGLGGTVLMLGLLAWTFFGGGPGDVASASLQPRTSVALLGVSNLTQRAEDAWLATALTEMLATEAAAGGALRVIPGTEVTRARLELGLEERSLRDLDLGETTRQRLGRLLGADFLVGGGYTVVGGAAGGDGDRQLRLDLRVEDARDGEILARFSRRGTEDRILDLVEETGTELRRNLGVAAESVAGGSALRASFPKSGEARRLYTEGLDALRHHELKTALDLLRGAAELAPGHAPVQSALASAWASVGHRPQSRAAARRALEILEEADELPRREALWVEGQALGVLGEHEEAAEIWAELARQVPDDVEVGLRLASSRISASEPAAAMQTVERLRGLVNGEDPRIALAAAEAARATSDYAAQRAAAERALAQAEELGASLMAARAREVLAGAARDLGEPDLAFAALESAVAAYEEAGLEGPAARARMAQAKLLRHQGRFDEAKPILRRTLEVAEEIGDLGTRKHALNTLAIIHRQQGRLSAALALHRLELEANEDTGDRRGVQISLTSLGVAQRRLGHLDEAESSFREALRLSRDSGSRRGVEINLNLLGEVLLRRGRPQEARTLFEEALAVNDDTSTPRGRAYYLSSLAEVDMLQGDLAAAREKTREALEIRREIQETTNVAYSLGSLAILDLARGLEPEESAREAASEALDHARAATEIFAEQAKDDAEAWSHALAARALARLGRVEEAKEEIRLAEERLEGSENLSYLLAVDLAAARVAAAAGDRERAVELASGVAERAARAGFVDARLESQIFLAGLGDERPEVLGAAEEARRRGLHGLLGHV